MKFFFPVFGFRRHLKQQTRLRSLLLWRLQHSNTNLTSVLILEVSSQIGDKRQTAIQAEREARSSRPFWTINTLGKRINYARGGSDGGQGCVEGGLAADNRRICHCIQWKGLDRPPKRCWLTATCTYKCVRNYTHARAHTHGKFLQADEY